MDGLLNQIDRVFDEHKLLGNYDFSEDDYSYMLEYVGNKCREFGSYCYGFDTKHYKLVFITLVEISKRWKETENVEDSEDNSRFWDYISKVLVGNNKIDNRLYSAFITLITILGRKKTIPVVKTGKRFYATLMMHSFAPKKSIFSFFDLCYIIYKKDLDYGFTSDDEWLCVRVADEMRTVLSGGYREDKKVSIGSNAYSIKIGLRSLSLNEDLNAFFIKFIKDTFYLINTLFNKGQVNGHTRLELYITEWWKNKTDSDKVFYNVSGNKRVSTVSKDNIVVKYIREENSVFLCIPPIRVDDDNNSMWLTVSCNGEKVHSEEMRTKRGELVVATKQIELELNDLLKDYCTINVKVEIKENQTVIFDSEKCTTTSLCREFILFEGQKEIVCHINKPANYFIFSKDIDSLICLPDEITTYANNLYNIYPKAGECITGKTQQYLFEDKTKTIHLGKKVCLLGGVLDVGWITNDISCAVYNKSVKMMVPETYNFKALELRINHKKFKLRKLKYELFENNCFQYGLKKMRLINDTFPTNVSLYSYEKEEKLLSATIIVLPSLEIKFNRKFYYGKTVRKVLISNENYVSEMTWSNNDGEIVCPLSKGTLIIGIPYLRWRINNMEWHNEPISKIFWYKDFLDNGDLFELDNPIEDEEIKIFVEVDGNSKEITKNFSGKYEIGRIIYANDNKQKINVYSIYNNEKIEFFNLSTKEHFIDNPLLYKEGKVIWDVENTFIGDKMNDFVLLAILKGKNERIINKKLSTKNTFFDDIDEGLYEVTVKIKDKNIFSKDERFNILFEDRIVIGKPEKFRFTNKILKLTYAYCYNGLRIPLKPSYYVDDLQYVEEDENIYYRGKLYEIQQDLTVKEINEMQNEKGLCDITNPIRIELRDKSTLWLVACWEGGNDYLGTLFCDLKSKSICNIAQEDMLFSEINIFGFKEEDYV